MARGKQTIHEPEIIPMLKTVEQMSKWLQRKRKAGGN